MCNEMKIDMIIMVEAGSKTEQHSNCSILRVSRELVKDRFELTRSGEEYKILLSYNSQVRTMQLLPGATKDGTGEGELD